MSRQNHQWAVFSKGRIKLKACATCGDVHLPSNSENECEGKNILNSQIIRAGYKPAGTFFESVKH